MKIDEAAECFQTRDARRVRSLAAIGLALGLGGPPSCILPTQIRSLTWRPSCRTWTRQDPEESFVKVAIVMCTEASKRGVAERIKVHTNAACALIYKIK